MTAGPIARFSWLRWWLGVLWEAVWFGSTWLIFTALAIKWGWICGR